MNDSNDDINSIRDESQKKGSNRLNGARDEIDRSVLLSLAAEQMPPPKASPRGKPMSVMRLILGECMCEPFPFSDNRGLSQTSQFVELHGVECISLGAVIDELSPDQRIRETLEQLTAAPKRMISIGYLVDEENPVRASGNQVAVNESANSNKITETVDLDVWRKNYPDDKNMSKPVAHIIKLIETRQFGAAIESFQQDLQRQKAQPNRNNNAYLSGITAHNIAVVYLFAGRSDKAFVMFEEALALKRASFGRNHPQVANTLVEVGIQLFAKERFQQAMDAFQESKRIRLKNISPNNPLVAMVLNNIACTDFLLRNNLESLAAFQEACDIQHDALGSTARADLDLLHAAITLCNFGYMKLRLKQYEEAQAVFEQALLIQQSVLEDDNNRAIRDTRSNMEFTNAFHS